MGTLTKVFIILLVVFSIAFTTMTISVVSQTTNWRDMAIQFQEHAQVADTNLRHMIASSAASLAAAKESVADRLDRINQLESQNQTSRNEVAQLRSELARAASEKSSSEAMNRGLLAQLRTAEAARAEYERQRNDLETRNIGLERRNVDLNDRVNELTAQVSVMLEQQRQFQQQINILRETSARLSRRSGRPSGRVAMEDPRGAGLPNVNALTPVATSAIRGHVLEVDGNLVTLSVGSADGVKKNMVFVVYRGDQYVGDVKVTLVEPNQSAGRTTTSKLAVQPGDEATDSIGLGDSRG
ncbi:MAG: hypothetical protein IIC51_03645 [Planctomycetes bacterium]|nr:hypothetical protein [Planctomycetota bacterium]